MHELELPTRIKHKISIKDVQDKKIEKLYDTMEYFYNFTKSYLNRWKYAVPTSNETYKLIIFNHFSSSSWTSFEIHERHKFSKPQVLIPKYLRSNITR